MSLYSAAQTLPPHIVQGIFSYVVWTKDVGSKMDKIEITTKDRKDLLILMKVCRHWRSVILPLYYYSASISIYEKGIGVFSNYASDMLDFDKVSENNSQQYIQSLRIIIWSSALVKPEAAIKALRNTVKQYGQLNRARAVILEFEYDRFDQPYNSSNPEDVTVMGDFDGVFTEYAKLFNDLLPNKCQLVFQSTNYFGNSHDSWLTTRTQVPNYFHLFLGENINSIQLKRYHLSEKLVGSLKKAQLKHLSIDSCNDSTLHINLIRQNASSLECLDLDNFPPSDILMLILPPGDSGVLTYPCLRKLNIDQYGDMLINELVQFESDPFPALEQFICKGELNNETLAILKMGNSHIRKLGFDIYSEMMNAIESNNIFTAGSYSALDSLCIGICSSYSSFDSRKTGKLIAMLLNLSPTTRHVHIDNTRGFNFYDTIFPVIIPSDSLRTLNLNRIFLRMHQIVKLASKFKNLDRLTVSIKDYPSTGLGVPDDNEVLRWKDELKAYTSNVRRIYIRCIYFYNLRRGVEYVVLLASILEGVGKVIFGACKDEAMLRNRSKCVQYALNRPVYKNCEYVHSVEFCMDDSPS